MIIKTFLLSFWFALLIGTAAAQTGPWPIVNGRHLQPTQQQVESRKANQPSDRDASVQSDIDKLYDEITRAGKPTHP